MEIPNEEYEIVIKGTRDVVRELNGPFKITTSGQMKYWESKKKQLDTSDGRQFNKVYLMDLYEALRPVRASSAHLALLLASFVSYNTNELRYSNGVLLHNHHISKITGKSRKFVSEAMKDLIDAHIFAKVTIGKSYGYFGNPFLFLIGDKVDKDICDMHWNYICSRKE